MISRQKAEIGMDFVITANSWSAAVDNPTSKHQVALELARQGHRVLWVEGAGLRRPSLGSASDRGRMVEKVLRSVRGAEQVAERIWRIAPLIIPLPSSFTARAVNKQIYLAAIALGLMGKRFSSPALINFLPNLPDVMSAWTGVSVYYCVDRWAAFDTYDSALMTELDEACCRQANLVIASSKDLFERCLKLNASTRLITHGVDYEHFSAACRKEMTGQRPADLPQGPIAGFIGLLSGWVDQDLLVKLARAIPGVTIVLIGKADVPVDKLKKEPNIFLIGPKSFAALPAYVAAFDVGIIPFLVNELTLAVNPIKLREMLAAGCRVVSTDLPEVCAFNGVSVAKTPGEFVKQVKSGLETPLTFEQKKVLSETMETETWAAKTRLIVEEVSRATKA